MSQWYRLQNTLVDLDAMCLVAIGEYYKDGKMCYRINATLTGDRDSICATLADYDTEKEAIGDLDSLSEHLKG